MVRRPFCRALRHAALSALKFSAPRALKGCRSAPFDGDVQQERGLHGFSDCLAA
jgi:hypothetical protein